MKKFVALILLLYGSLGASEPLAKDLPQVWVAYGQHWHVKQITLLGRQPPLSFSLATPEKAVIRTGRPWFSVINSPDGKTTYTLRVRREGAYLPPKSYQEFKQQMLNLVGGLNILKESRVKRVHPGIIYRMDLNFSPNRSGVVTLKGSLIATADAFYFLTVKGDLSSAEVFFDHFIPLTL